MCPEFGCDAGNVVRLTEERERIVEPNDAGVAFGRKTHAAAKTMRELRARDAELGRQPVERQNPARGTNRLGRKPDERIVILRRADPGGRPLDRRTHGRGRVALDVPG